LFLIKFSILLALATLETPVVDIANAINCTFSSTDHLCFPTVIPHQLALRVVPLRTLVALNPGLPIAVVVLRIHLVAVVAVGLGLIKLETKIAELHFVAIGQSYPVQILAWKLAWHFVVRRVRGAKAIIAFWLLQWLRSRNT